MFYTLGGLSQYHSMYVGRPVDVFFALLRVSVCQDVSDRRSSLGQAQTGASGAEARPSGFNNIGACTVRCRWE